MVLVNITETQTRVGDTYTVTFDYEPIAGVGAIEYKTIEYGTGGVYDQQAEGDSITGLEPNKEYCVRITEYYSDTNGTSIATGEHTFTTEGLPPTISNVRIYDITESSFTVDADVSFDINSSKDRYGVSWDESDGSMNGTNPSSFPYVCDYISPGTYISNMHVFAFDNFDRKGESEKYEFQLPSTYKIDGKNISSIRLNRKYVVEIRLNNQLLYKVEQ